MTEAKNHSEMHRSDGGSLRRDHNIAVSGYSLEPFCRLHTLLQDESANCYFSDEMRHVVVCVNKEGALVWKHGGKGSAPGQFHYPRGMALGQVCWHGQIVPCIGVCDAWNCRVQFFSLEGHFLCGWTEAGGRKFGEVSDIRYLASSAADPSGIWVILDRGNHRLCALSCEGMQIYKIGCEFPSSLESRWIPSNMYDPLDPLYYPTRILGYEENALFVYESGSRQIKQILFGNACTLPWTMEDGFCCLAAGENLFFTYRESTQECVWLDLAGNRVGCASLRGYPVVSNLPVTEVLIQAGDQLQHWQFEGMAQKTAWHEQRDLWSAWRRDLDRELQTANAVILKELLQRVGVTVRCYLQICDSLIPAHEWQDQESAAIVPLREEARTLHFQSYTMLLEASTQLSALRLPIRRLRLLYEADYAADKASDTELSTFYEALRTILRPISSAMIEAQKYLGATYSCLHELAKHESGHKAILHKAVEEQGMELQSLTRELLRMAGMASEVYPFVSHEAVLSPAFADAKGSFALPSMCAPQRRRVKPGSGYLYQQECIALPSSVFERHAGLNCVCCDSHGYFFASFFRSGSLLRLCPDGKVDEELFGPGSSRGTLGGPSALFWDSPNKIWISEYLSQSISVFDLAMGTYHVIRGTTAQCRPYQPLGLCPGPQDTMLVADSGNDRILSVQLPDRIDFFAGSTGTGPLEFRHPLSIVRDRVESKDIFWIADELNHRVQCVDASGKLLREFGQCGPFIHDFVMPQQISQFSDGTLVVMQNHNDHCLKLFGREGNELNRLYLDYVPGGMGMADNSLVVTEYEGRRLFIYQRE